MTLTEARDSPTWLFPFLLGAVSLTVQVVLVRRLMAVFSGNELVIAVALAAWLLGSSAGALIGGRLPADAAGRWYTWALIGLGVLFVPLASSIFLLRPALGLGPGEMASLPAILISSLIALPVPAAIFGLGFSVILQEQPEGTRPGWTYGFEGLGYAAAGLVLAGIMWLGDPKPGLEAGVAGFTVLVLACFPTAHYEPERKLGFILAIIVTMLFLHLCQPRIDRAWLPAGVQFGYQGQTSQGLLMTGQRQGEWLAFLDGVPVETVPDLERDRPRVLLPLALLDKPWHAAIIGGGYLGLTPLLQQWPVPDVYVVTENRSLLRQEGEFEYRRDLQDTKGKAAPGSGPRPNFYVENPLAWLKACPGCTNLIIVNAGAPVTAAGERFFTREFFAAARGALAPGGILVFPAGETPPNLAFTPAQSLLAGGILATARSVFPRVVLLPLGQNLALAGDESSPLTADPERLIAALVAHGIEAPELAPAQLRSDLDPERVAEVERKLSEARPPVSDALHPRGYLYGLVAWTEAASGVDSPLARALLAASRFTGTVGWLAALPPLLALGLRMLPGRRGRAAGLGAAIGFYSMTAEVALLIAYQMNFGSIYLALSGLVAAFMAGLGLGAARVDRLSARLAGLAAVALLLSGAAAGFLPLRVPLSAILWAVPLGLIGAGVGAAFVVAAGLSGDGAVRAGGMVYGLELIGSAGGGLVAGIFLVPVFGIIGTLTAAGSAAVAAAVLAWPSGKV